MTSRAATKYLELLYQAEVCTDRYRAHEILRRVAAIEGEVDFVNRITKLYNS